MPRYFMNPSNQYVERATTRWSWLWAFLFSFIYFAVRGAWAAALIFLIVGLCLEAVHWAMYVPVGIVAAMMCEAIVSRAYLRKGWVEIAEPSGKRGRQREPVWTSDQRSS